MAIISKIVSRTSHIMIIFMTFLIGWCISTYNYPAQQSYGRNLIEFTNPNGTHRWRWAQRLERIITAKHVWQWSSEEKTRIYWTANYSWDLASIKNTSLQQKYIKQRQYKCTQSDTWTVVIHTDRNSYYTWNFQNNLISFSSKKWDSWGIISQNNCIKGIISQSTQNWTRIIPISDNF